MTTGTPINGGNDVTDRPTADSWGNFYMVDTNGPIDGDGLLSQWQIYARNTLPVQLVIYRRQGDTFTVVGKSPVETPAVGTNTFALDKKIAVEKGDLVGWYYPQRGSIAFVKDDGPWNFGNLSGTTLFTNQGQGETSFSGSSNRHYSIAVSGVEAAQAVAFKVERLSDTQAIVTASGSFAATTPSQRGARVMLIAPMAQAVDGAAELTENTMASTNASKLTGADTFAKTFKAGGKTVQALRLVFDVNHVEGDSVSGSARLQLPSGCVLAPVGSSGEVWYGNDNRANLSTQTGQWTMVEGAINACDPSRDFDFTISAKLVGEERIDPHEEEATIEVRVGTRISAGTIWHLTKASLVLTLDDVPKTIALGPGTQFDLDVGAMNDQKEVVVPLTVKTGTFAGAATAAAAGDYPIRASIDASYLTSEVKGTSEGGTFNVTVARD